MKLRGDPQVARAVLADANQTHGCRFHLISPLEGGLQAGMWLLADAEGEPAVLKWSPNRHWAPQVMRAADAVARIRAAGYPTPAWYAAGTSGFGYAYQIQEFVTGATASSVTSATARVLIDVLESQAGLDPDPQRCWSAHVASQLTDQWPASHQAVAAIGPGMWPFLDTCEHLLDATKPVVLPTGDLVHGDFRPGNILLDGERVTGIIDIEALGSGTRAYDYATLLTADHLEPAAQQEIIEAGRAAAGPTALTHCLIAVVLDLVLFMHRNDRPNLDSAATRLHAVLRNVAV